MFVNMILHMPTYFVAIWTGFRMNAMCEPNQTATNIHAVFVYNLNIRMMMRIINNATTIIQTPLAAIQPIAYSVVVLAGIMGAGIVIFALPLVRLSVVPYVIVVVPSGLFSMVLS